MEIYDAVVRSALLTAQRFHKVSLMQRADLKDRVKVEAREVDGVFVPEVVVDDVWDATRKDDPFNKGVSPVPLSPMAREVLNSVPSVDGENLLGLVFTLTGKGPLKGWSKFKRQLDKAMLKELQAMAVERNEDPDKVQLETSGPAPYRAHADGSGRCQQRYR